MAKKDLSRTYTDDTVEFNFNLSEKQYEALVTPATEIFFGGKLCASFHSDVSK